MPPVPTAVEWLVALIAIGQLMVALAVAGAALTQDAKRRTTVRRKKILACEELHTLEFVGVSI